MSKKPASVYTREDLDKPKVKGLAVHNAILETNKAFVKYDEGLDVSRIGLYPELYAYNLWAIREDAAVVCVAGAPTAADFLPLKSKTNLGALTIKYRPIGFLLGKRRAKGIGYDYEVVQAPKVEGGRK